MMSIWNSILGTGTAAILGMSLSNTMQPPPPPPPMNQQMMNQYQWASQQYQNFPPSPAPPPPKWMYNGEFCTAQEFAVKMWPDDEESRLMFLLKHPE